MSFRPLLLVIMFMANPFAQAQVPQAFAVQSRPYYLQHEISVSLGYLPIDNYHTYSAAGLGYTHYVNDYFAWEVFNANLTNANSTGLDRYLAREEVTPDPKSKDQLKHFITSNVIYTPFYTKNLFRGERIIWGDMSLTAGGGVSQFEKSGSVGTFDMGGFIRLFVGQKNSVKLDTRFLSYASGGHKPNMSLTLSYSYHWVTNQDQARQATEGIE